MRGVLGIGFIRACVNPDDACAAASSDAKLVNRWVVWKNSVMSDTL